MKRLTALFLVLGLLAAAVTPAPAKKDEDKEKVEKKEEKKEEKKVEVKIEKKSEEKKAEEKKPEEKKEEPKAEEKKEPEQPSAGQAKELEKLTGTFEVTVFEREGKKSDNDDLKKMKVVQTGSKWSFVYGDTTTEGFDKVNPGKTPKEIDSTYTNGPEKNKVVRGIYEATGDTVRYCWAETGKDRPKDFATKADSGLTMMELKRVKDEPKAKEEKKEETKVEKKEEKKDE